MIYEDPNGSQTPDLPKVCALRRGGNSESALGGKRQQGILGLCFRSTKLIVHAVVCRRLLLGSKVDAVACLIHKTHAPNIIVDILEITDYKRHIYEIHDSGNPQRVRDWLGGESKLQLI